MNPYALNPATFGRLLPRGDFDHLGLITDGRINDILGCPWAYAPTNRYYQKNHVSAPGTVRAWFRAMRAEDFATDVHLFWTKRDPQCHVDHLWTVLDSQAVIDRETAAHYETDPFARSLVPWFRAHVPSGPGGALTLDLIRAWIDDCAHVTGLRGDPASPGAGRERTQ